MQTNSGKPIAKPKPAATVMLVRDGREGVEVLLLKRGSTADFGNAYVFPGGINGPGDDSADLPHHCWGLSATRAAELLGLDGGALAYWITAIRECFEESGILLARTRAGARLDISTEPHRARFAALRARLDRGALSIGELCERENILLACADLHYVSYWTTPVDSVRRYATRFFVAAVPPGQVGESDGRETVDSLWIAPERALLDENRQQLNLRPPTIGNLQHLLGFASCGELIEALASRKTGDIPEIVPRVTRGPGGIEIELEKFWPGATRETEDSNE